LIRCGGLLFESRSQLVLASLLRLEQPRVLRRMAATAGVLKAISRSTYNLQDVLDSLIESAVHLTGAEQGLIVRQDGAYYRAAAIYGAPPEFVEVARQNPIPRGANRRCASASSRFSSSTVGSGA
jgi:hypothetical protein